MRHDIKDTDRLDFVLEHCEISSEYKTPSQFDRDFIDACIDAHDLDAMRQREGTRQSYGTATNPP